MEIEPVYRQLLEVMQKRRGRYAGLDIPEFWALVKELFSPEEAEVNNAMPRGTFTAADLAKQMEREENEIKPILENMANKGTCAAVTVNGIPYYRGARFMPGILEFQFMPGTFSEQDKKMARLIYDYKAAFDASKDPSAPEFPSFRVITVDRTIEVDNQVHTYDQVQTFIDKHDQIAITTCYCRHAALLRDKDIHDMPTDVCMQFGGAAQFAVERLGARKLDKKQAREVLTRAEEAGLIHMSQNITDDAAFICNCDRWHCVAVKSAMAKPKPGVFFNSGFEPRFDPEACVACETCIDRCPPEALTLGDDDLPKVDLDLCFGCAVCASGCPSAAITMVNKPGFPEPPKDLRALKEAIKAGS